MTTSLRFLGAGLIALAGLLLAPSAQASILTFDVQFGGGYGGIASFRTFADYQPYGDNVSSTSAPSGGYTLNYLQGNGWTPDVTASYDVGTDNNDLDLKSDDQPADNWLRVARLFGGNANEADRTYYFTLDPGAGHLVMINSFDLLRYTGSGGTGTLPGQQMTLDWAIYKNAGLTKVSDQVTALSGTLVTGGSVSLGDNSSDSATVTTGTGYLSGPAILVITNTTILGGGNRLAAIDNLNFDQAVAPEPCTMALLALSVPVFLRRRRA